MWGALTEIESLYKLKKNENLAGAKGPYKAVSQEFHLE